MWTVCAIDSAAYELGEREAGAHGLPEEKSVLAIAQRHLCSAAHVM
jgi:hypothetical protein